MTRPVRRYALHLSLKLHIPVNELLMRIDSVELAEYMAWDLLQTEEFQERYKKEQEREESRQLSADEYAAKFKALIGGNHG